MTIPIRPGPFSFLANIGQAVGGGAQGLVEGGVIKNDRERKDREEAFKQLGWIFENVQSGNMPSSVFKSPAVAELVGKSGINESFMGAAEGAPRPQEQVRGMQSDFLSNLPSMGPEGAATQDYIARTGKIPLRSEAGTEAAKTGAITEGGAAARAVTGVPSEGVAQAAEAGQTAENVMKQTKMIQEEADTFVAQALMGVDPRKMGVEAAVEKAYQLYLQDTTNKKIAPLPPEVAQRYFAEAAQRRIDYLKNQEIAAIRASNPLALHDPQLGALNVQIDNLNQDLARANDGIRNFVATMTAAPEIARKIPALAAEVQTYDQLVAARDAKQSELTQLQARYSNLYQGKFGGTPTPANPQEERQRGWDAAAAHLRKQHPGISVQQIEQAIGEPRPQ